MQERTQIKTFEDYKLKKKLIYVMNMILALTSVTTIVVRKHNKT